MDFRHLTQRWYGHLVIQSPMLLICVAACVVIIAKRGWSSSWTLWALSGFGLNVLLYTFLPWIQGSTELWFLQSHLLRELGIPAFVATSFTWSLLHAITYTLLLVAFLVPRPSSPPSTSSLSPQSPAVPPA